MKVEHPEVTGGLNLTYGTGGTYGGFDRFGRVIDQKWENDSSTVKDRFRYGYDYAGNRVWRENTQSTTRSEFYTYDGLQRLKNMDRGTLSGSHPSYSAPASPTVERDFSLDQLGNWGGYTEKLNGSATLTQMREHNDANEIFHATYGSAITETTGNSWIDPVHDLAGNMILAPKPGDEATSSEGVVCVYDAWNRLAATYKDSDSGHDGAADANDTLIATYEYDGLNHRIVKLVWDNTNEDWDRTDYYYTDSAPGVRAWQVIEERFAADVADEDKGDVATNAKYQYVWDIRYIDAPVLRDADSDSDGDCVDSGGSERLYYTNDANMNVTALVQTDGTIAERYVYDVYGKVTIYNADWSSTVNWAASKQNEILFAGYRHDPETGLYQVRYRVYHPTLGRWNQHDPLGYVDGMGLYEYVRGMLGTAVDPHGLIGECCSYTGESSIGTAIASSKTFPTKTPKGEQWLFKLIQGIVNSVTIHYEEYICTCKYVCIDYDWTFEINIDATLEYGQPVAVERWVRDPTDDTVEWRPEGSSHHTYKDYGDYLALRYF